MGKRIYVERMEVVANARKASSKQISEDRSIRTGMAKNLTDSNLVAENNNGGAGDSVSWKLYHPIPIYPELAREKGWEGSVKIKISTDENGLVIEETLAESSGFKVLDEAAVKAVKEWRTHANLNREVVPITFRLYDL